MASTQTASSAETESVPVPTNRMGEGRKYLSTPAILFLILVTQVPFAMTIWYSFTGWNLLRPNSTGFLGWGQMWRNFSRILSNPDFWFILWNTIYLTGAVVIVSFVFGMLFALLLNRPFPGRGIARTLLISPFLVMPVAAAVVWKFLLLDPSNGLSAWVMRIVLRMRSVYLVEAAPMESIILIVSWQWIPFVMLILLAGLQSLPDEIVEAAQLDGAGPWGMFVNITLPHLRRFIEIALLLEMIFVLSIFGHIFVVTSGGPGIQTTNLPYQIFLEAFSSFNIGRASAYGIFAIILANIVMIFFLQVVRRHRLEGDS